MEKNNLIFVINNEELSYYFWGNRVEVVNINEIENFLESIESKVKSVKIFFTDNNIFIEKFNINVSRANEARAAALNMLLLNSVNSKDEITFKKVIVEKDNNKNFIATVIYTYLNIDWLFDILKKTKSNLYKKIEGIYPLFQIFIDKNRFCYTLEEIFYTYIEDSGNIFIFKSLDNKNIPDDITVKELIFADLKNFLNNFDNKLSLNFIDTGKYEIYEKLFLPIIIALVIFNIFMFSFLMIKQNKLEKRLTLIKNQVNQELKELEPFQKASDKYSKINKLIENVRKFRNSSFPFNELVKSLATIKKIWVRQISLNNGNVIINGKAESAFAVLEVIKKLNFLQDPKINSKIIRDRNGFERFTIRAKYKNAFKN